MSGLKLSSVQYQLSEDPFMVPVRFKRELPLNRNLFELADPEPKNYPRRTSTPDNSESSMLDPLAMSVASIKLLLVEKALALTALFSVGLSLYQVYAVEPDSDLEGHMLQMSAALTATMCLLALAVSFFHAENVASRRMHLRWFWERQIVRIVCLLLAPSPWCGSANRLLQVGVLLRLYFPAAYLVRSSVYYQPRAARILNIYGIKPEFTFQFAWKVLLNVMPIWMVLLFYVCVVLLYTHCLFLVSSDTPFIDCFEMVIVTLPTVGFGDYKIAQIGPRCVILATLITGVALNAFVTLSMLKKFQMSTSENNSYVLMQKLKMVEEIETLSSEFIIRKIRIKQQGAPAAERERDDSFKEQYKECKARYRTLNPQDSIYQFNYFKDTLQQLKIKMQQANNMIAVLLTRLAVSRKLTAQPLKLVPR